MLLMVVRRPSLFLQHHQSQRVPNAALTALESAYHRTAPEERVTIPGSVLSVGWPIPILSLPWFAPSLPSQPFITMVGDAGRTTVRMDRTAGKMNASGLALGTGEQGERGWRGEGRERLLVRSEGFVCAA